MIVPMKKVSLVVLDNTKNDSLKKLRKLGVVHLEQIQGSGEVLADLKDKNTTIETACRILSDVKIPNKKASKEATKEEKASSLSKSDNDFSKEDALQKAQRVLDCESEKKKLQDQLLFVNNELSRLKGWGKFNPSDLQFLASRGIYLSTYEIPADKYAVIPEDISTVYVNGDKSQVRFLLFTKNGEKPENLPPQAYAVSLGDKSFDELNQAVVQIKLQIDQLSGEVVDLAKFIPLLNKANELYLKDIEFETVSSGMGSESELAWLTGFVPSSDLPKVKDFAKQNNWAILADNPSVEDEVPTKLKNNKLVSLIYPITDFLGTVPGYREYDISGWFLLFFSIFFGMIFGDAGYGSILTLMGLAIVFSSLVKGKKPAPMMVLLCVLGLTTFLWGMITCTWFGLSADKLPSWLVDLSYYPLSNANPDENLRNSNLKIFCFSLALIQLSVAHIKGIIANIKSPKFLGELGSLMMLWAMFYVVLNIVVDKQRFTLDSMIFGVNVMNLLIIFLGGGFVLNFVFSNYEGNLGKSILASCQNIISVLLGVVNIFSDIVSYIRLWAVALAGGAISQTVNAMAGSMLGGALLFVGVLLLVFGHGMNMILNVLSVLVHGVRLNTLEFTSHLGMSWSGFAYKPFSENR